VNINLTLFGQMVTFAFFVWFCMKFVWPVIIEAMEERQKKSPMDLMRLTVPCVILNWLRTKRLTK